MHGYKEVAGVAHLVEHLASCKREAIQSNAYEPISHYIPPLEFRTFVTNEHQKAFQINNKPQKTNLELAINTSNNEKKEIDLH